MSYKVIKNDEKHYQIMHPDGTKFSVPKKGISKDMLSKIEGLPKFVDGGITGKSEGLNEEPSSVAPYIPPHFSPDTYPVGGSGAPSFSGLIENVQAGPNGVPSTSSPVQDQIDPARDISSQSIQQPKESLQDILASTSSAPESKIVDTGASSAPPPAYDMGMGEYNKALDKISANAGAGAAMTKAAGDTYSKAVSDQTNKFDDIATQAKENADNQAADLEKTVEEHKINPKNFWGNLSTPSKILAGISLALGGIGSGLTGQPNAALGIINKRIEDDINSQKENRDSLYNSVLQKYKNKDMALAAARLAATEHVDAASKQYMASANTAQAVQNAQNFQNQVGMQKAQLGMQVHQMMQNQFINQKLYGEGIPTEQMPAMLRADPKLSQQMVDVDGTTYMYKGAPAEAAIHNKMEANYRPIVDAINEIKTLGPNAVNPLSEEGQKARSLVAALPTKLSGFYSAAIDSKRINEAEAHRSEEALSDPTSFIQGAKNDDLR